MQLKDEIIELIENSAEDYFLSKSEKKAIQAVLKTAQPDKRMSDLLRSELFSIARSKSTADNYLEIISWTEKINKLILAANKIEVQQEKVYFSPGEECLQAILNHINNTVNTIRICLFTISDDRISDALITKHNYGTDIRIISDNDKILDLGSDIEKLHQAGIQIKIDVTDKHMHHKFALFDHKITLTGSYNWTRSAERFNHENILITDSKTVLKAYKKEFDALWNEFPDFY